MLKLLAQLVFLSSPALLTSSALVAQGQGGGQAPSYDCCKAAHEGMPEGCATPCLPTVTCSGNSSTVAVAGACQTSTPPDYCTSSGSKHIQLHVVTCRVVDCGGGEFKCEWTLGDETNSQSVDECSGSPCS